MFTSTSDMFVAAAKGHMKEAREADTRGRGLTRFGEKATGETACKRRHMDKVKTRLQES